jgi:hypothetical protein
MCRPRGTLAGTAPFSVAAPISIWIQSKLRAACWWSRDDDTAFAARYRTSSRPRSICGFNQSASLLTAGRAAAASDPASLHPRLPAASAATPPPPSPTPPTPFASRPSRSTPRGTRARSPRPSSRVAVARRQPLPRRATGRAPAAVEPSRPSSPPTGAILCRNFPLRL